jgi:hypothetical protein
MHAAGSAARLSDQTKGKLGAEIDGAAARLAVETDLHEVPASGNERHHPSAFHGGGLRGEWILGWMGDADGGDFPEPGCVFEGAGELRRVRPAAEIDVEEQRFMER